MGTLADLTLEVGESPSVEVSGAFRDRDGDVLTYAAESSAAEVAAVSAVSVSGGVVTVSVTALAAGAAAVTCDGDRRGGLEPVGDSRPLR